MLEITYFYWLLGVFLLYAAWCNARQRRWAHAGFWALLAATFGGGDWILAASDTGNDVPAQLAGAAINGNAVATCIRITAFGSSSSSSAAGTRLKLAAIGVSSVPQ